MSAGEPHAVFVRAVMIGRDGLHAAVLLDLVRSAGGIDPVNHLSTGNVTCRLDPDGLDEFVPALESGVGRVVGRQTEVFVRSRDELGALVAADPFATSPFSEPQHRLVTFYAQRAPEFELPMVSPRGDSSVFATGPRELFSVTQEVDGRVQDPGGTIERLGGERVTTRAWATVTRAHRKLHELY